MRPLCWTCPILLALAGLARADPELSIGDAHLALPVLRDPAGGPAATDPAAPWAAAAGYAGAVASDGGAGLVVGAHAAVSGFDCALVDLTAHAELASSHVADEAQYRICLLGAPFRMVIAGARGRGLAPSLDARRSLWRRRFDEDQVRYELGLGELVDPRSGPGHDTYRHSLMMIGFEHDTTSQTDGTGALRTAEIRGDAALYRVRRTTPGSQFQVDALELETDAIKAGPTDRGGVANAIYPIAITADADRWFGALRVGVGSLGGTSSLLLESDANGKPVSTTRDTVTSSGLPELSAAVGDATFGVRHGEVTASATIARAVFPTFDGDQALESRVAGHFEIAHGKTHVAVAPFLAHTRTWTREQGARRDVAAGASLSVGRALSHHLDLDAVGEAGKSPYARLDGSRSPVAATGGQLMVALGVHRGARHPR